MLCIGCLYSNTKLRDFPQKTDLFPSFPQDIRFILFLLKHRNCFSMMSETEEILILSHFCNFSFFEVFPTNSRKNFFFHRDIKPSHQPIQLLIAHSHVTSVLLRLINTMARSRDFLTSLAQK